MKTKNIIVEGTNWTGKTTLINNLDKFLKTKGFKTEQVYSSFDERTEIGREIKENLKVKKLDDPIFFDLFIKNFRESSKFRIGRNGHSPDIKIFNRSFISTLVLNLEENKFNKKFIIDFIKNNKDLEFFENPAFIFLDPSLEFVYKQFHSKVDKSDKSEKDINFIIKSVNKFSFVKKILDELKIPCFKINLSDVYGGCRYFKQPNEVFKEALIKLGDIYGSSFIKQKFFTRTYSRISN